LPTSEFLGVSSGLRRGLWLSAVFPFLLRREPKKDIWSSQADVQGTQKRTARKRVCTSVITQSCPTITALGPISALVASSLPFILLSTLHCFLILCSLHRFKKVPKKEEKITYSKTWGDKVKKKSGATKTTKTGTTPRNVTIHERCTR
jgi:hypothetical protein